MTRTVAAPALAGILWLLGLRDFESPAAATPALVPLGLGFGFTAAPAQASAMASVPRSEAGMAAGATSSLRYLGGMLSVLVLGAVFGPGGAGDLDAHETVLHCFTVVLGVAALVCFALPDSIGEPAAKAG